MSTPQTALRQFDSLGTNCEFGLVMRHFEVETPGLLKWAGCQPELEALLQALRTRFAGAGEDVDVFGDAISRDNKLNMVFHTGRQGSGVAVMDLWRQEMARISYLARNMVEDLEEASRIYVFKRSKGVSEAWVREMHQVLATYGPVWLLWVEEAKDETVVGSVELIGPRLMKGWIDEFSPEDKVWQSCSFDLWLTLCRKALALREAQQKRASWQMPSAATIQPISPPGQDRGLIRRLLHRMKAAGFDRR